MGALPGDIGRRLVPGFTPECMSGAHSQCAMRDCRCQCHPWTQALMAQGPAKPDGRGGVRRKLKNKISETVQNLPQLPEPEPVPLMELHNTCPKCGAVSKPTDQFCRKDGTRLVMGRPCERCEAPCEETDAFCWQCGWKLGDKLPVQETVIPPNGVPSVDRITAIVKAAKERGIQSPLIDAMEAQLKVTTV